MKTQKLNKNQIKRKNEQLTQCKNLPQIARLLKTTPKELTLLAFEPLYYHFTIPKKNGNFRHIEAPSKELKRIQRNLNHFLQCVYYLNQSKASYGYIIKANGQKTVKNIYTNALQHLGNNYMLNADFKDFFHQIKIADINTIFKGKLFNFDNHTAYTLAKICSYKERLPMGAPTSPALSNLYTLNFDKTLRAWATNNNFVFTRFVDDLSFSSKNNPITNLHFEQINTIAVAYHLKFNTQKTKFFNKEDKKTVTGLVLNETVDIDNAYYKELDKDLVRLTNVMEVYYITNKIQGLAFLKAFKQQIMGKINFIRTIEGVNSSQYNSYLNKFQQALEPSDNLINRWTKFSNYL